ncbi:LytR/AlgR family response regulator transcription factor [Lachnoclostridium phytofermentans]|uniref:Stage 0 sporulation protein A homolog n=1 Tax=Lachnoclostridium phytofermentans (strain ATCC 700394 / DSM 18823 / ISDg) TaxID=357809 RepID=A9KQR1_LACP7|nr:LytTR family DNA-binding domain-containing protein [Lachnoclostridium phytofermentans]ABX41974.1 two component transcriptional regulator, LytTR family [Lachnoclostridium phytofermentans ISDg]
MLTILLCDDNKETLSQYAGLTQKIARKNKVEVVISAFSSGEQLLFHLSDNPDKADIIYLDILMSKLNGLDTARKLRELECKAEIVFLTTSEDYVFDAFDVSPVQYLIKATMSAEKFEQVFLRALALVQKKATDMFLCESANTQTVIPIKDISFFEIWKRVVTVHYNRTETINFYSKMEELEKQLLNKGFVRIHRSYIVNLTYISKFQQNSLYLKTGENVPIGVTYMKQVRRAFFDYISSASIHRF